MSSPKQEYDVENIMENLENMMNGTGIANGTFVSPKNASPSPDAFELLLDGVSFPITAPRIRCDVTGLIVDVELPNTANILSHLNQLYGGPRIALRKLYAVTIRPVGEPSRASLEALLLSEPMNIASVTTGRSSTYMQLIATQKENQPEPSSDE